MADQLPLDLERPERHRLELFHPGAGVREAWERVLAVAEGQARFGYLWGGPGTGKTHLLEGASRTGSGIYLDLAAARSEIAEAGWEPEGLIAALPAGALVALDNLDAVAGDPAWETALFHLFNRLSEEGGRFLAASEANPNRLGLAREELRSRLLWGGSFRLTRLTDDERLGAIQAHAEARGLELRDAVGAFLLRHYPRNMHQLMAALERLEESARAEQRRLTLPFVKARLGL